MEEKIIFCEHQCELEDCYYVIELAEYHISMLSNTCLASTFFRSTAVLVGLLVCLSYFYLIKHLPCIYLVQEHSNSTSLCVGWVVSFHVIKHLPCIYLGAQQLYKFICWLDWQFVYYISMLANTSLASTFLGAQQLYKFMCLLERQGGIGI